MHSGNSSDNNHNDNNNNKNIVQHVSMIMVVLKINTDLNSGGQIQPKVFYRRALDTRESDNRNKYNNNTLQNYLEYKYWLGAS